MDRLAPVPMVRLLVTRYGPLAACQTVLPLMAPPAIVPAPAPLSYQMAMEVLVISVPFVPRAWIRTLLMPGWSPTLLFVQRASQADHVDAAPFTRMLRVSMALAWPRSETT